MDRKRRHRGVWKVLTPSDAMSLFSSACSINLALYCVILHTKGDSTGTWIERISELKQTRKHEAGTELATAQLKTRH